jgi:hypothetical protein
MKPDEPMSFDPAQRHFADARRIAKKMANKGTTAKRVHKRAEQMKAALKGR